MLFVVLIVLSPLQVCDEFTDQKYSCMATALQSQTDKRPGAQSQKHGQQQQQQQQLRKRKWEEDDAGVPVEVSTPEKIIVHEIRTFFTNQGREHKPWRTSCLRARTAVQDQGLRLKRATVWTTDWMLQGGTWQTFFSAAVCVYSLSFFTYKCLMMDILLLLLLLLLLGSDLPFDCTQI